MCYSVGTVEAYTATCEMCTVWKHTRCPHKREICRNRTLHPRIDVLFLKNAEVDLFNGCGYCKWAKTNPPTNLGGLNNPGWPGCCRPPAPNELAIILPTEWEAVNKIHRTPIPAEMKPVVERMAAASALGLSRPIGSPKSTSTKPATPPLDRRGSGNTNTTPRPSNKPTSSGTTIKGKSGGSPSSSNSGGSPGSPYASPRGSLELQAVRDALPAERKENRTSPGRRSLELAESLRKNTSARNLSSSPRTSGEIKRKTSQINVHVIRGTISPTTPKPIAAQISNSHSSVSSGSSSNGSDSTITSDGGFTDYLSDESEQELQRQAEAKAALIAQNQAEELEFKAARQRLIGVTLRPDDHWKGTGVGTLRQRA
ncbi:hypothetical protein DL96DRAFT_971397 [Flagelloscypha sp. PMI_526]|nr:hypothetical protein DL96DRAFT_971397 [Flagelloscypha sp. PMI_526]